MSANSTSYDEAAAAAISKFNIPGGLPSSVDLAPSIIFFLVYLALTPVLIWRWARRASRTLILIRPSIFVAVRLGSLILRAVMSKTHYGINELIAELVLVSIGYLFLISPVVEMWKRHVYSEVCKEDQPAWLRKWVRVADLVLLAAIITAVVGASEMGSGNYGLVKTMRRVSAALSLAVVVLTLLGAVYTHATFGLRTPPTLVIVGIAVPLLVVALYRIIQAFSTNPSNGINSRAAFWILQITMEVLALGGILAVNINDMFPALPEPQPESEAQDQYKIVSV